MRKLIANLQHLNEELLLFKTPQAVESAAKMEAEAHRLLNQIQQVLNAPTGPDPFASTGHEITIDSGAIIIRSSPSLPVGRYALSEYDRENVMDAIEESLSDLPPANDAELLAEILRSNLK